jgi:predicted ATPase
MTLLLDVVAGGAQVLLATHSPVLAALPGARILEVGSWGVRESSWPELELTANWRAFLEEPDAFLRHLT